MAPYIVVISYGNFVANEEHFDIYPSLVRGHNPCPKLHLCYACTFSSTQNPLIIVKPDDYNIL